MSDKPFFHELPQEDIDLIKGNRETWGFVLDNFRQPTWCGMPRALNGHMGCWSLTDLSPNGPRMNVSPSFCAECEYCRE